MVEDEYSELKLSIKHALSVGTMELSKEIARYVDTKEYVRIAMSLGSMQVQLNFLIDLIFDDYKKKLQETNKCETEE